MSTLNVNNINEAGGVEAVITAGVVDSGSLPAGSILQVVSTTKTDTFSASVGARPTISGGVTGLSATITPTSASSKLLVFGSIVASAGGQVVHLHLFRDGSASGYTADSAGSRQVSASGRIDMRAGDDSKTYAFNFLDDAVSTSATTYDFRISHDLTSTSTVYVNRSINDTDASNFGRGVSSITIMEVAG